MSTTTDTIKVWAGCLQCYNAGELRGEWLELTGDSDDDWAAIDEIRSRHIPTDPDLDPYGIHEEWAALDHEGLPQGYGESLLEAIAFAETIETARADFPWLSLEQLGEAIEAIGIDSIEDGSASPIGEFDSWADLAGSMVDDGLYGEIPETIAAYLDLDAIGRDLEYGGGIAEIAGMFWYVR